jgi:hypothetical protein
VRRLLAAAVLAVALGVASSAAVGAAGEDAVECGKLAGTRSVSVIAYSVSCTKAKQVMKRAILPYRYRTAVHEVRRSYLGYRCRGGVSRRRASVSCRRGGGAQFITARGATS